MIIDAHCHAGRGVVKGGRCDTPAAIDDYLRRAAAAGIDRTVLFAPFHHDYRVANRDVARIIRRHPKRFYGFAFVHAVRDRSRMHELVREAVEEHGFRGIKVHRHDARITRAVCEAARRWSLPVLYDVFGEVATIDTFASAYPDVDFIIPHLGTFLDHWSVQCAFLDVLTRHANVYTDTSGVRRVDLIEQAVLRAGAEKVVFGTDSPWLHPGVELQKIRVLEIAPADQRKIVSGNILRLMSATSHGVSGSPGR
ncbi:MAG TPA: amidohydrolase family protein [Thermoanaerobaculia bacterium]|nr:amidohydrolase family protein [Thermoanaerobaculia bacterium]